MSSYYTLISKIALCPQYNRSVVFSAKYRFTENPQNDYEVKFAYATCPIVEIQDCPKMNNVKNINIWTVFTLIVNF